MACFLIQKWSERFFIDAAIGFFLLLALPIYAQPNLEDTIPSNYTAVHGTLSISNEHYRLGASSLRWDWVGGDTLKITGISVTDAFTWGLNTFSTWVYSEKPLSDTIKFQFINTTNDLKFWFDYLIKYSGWRFAVQSYRFDMAQGVGTWSIKAIHIVAPATGSGSLFFDDFNYIRSTVNGMADSQMPYLPGNGVYMEYTAPPLVPITPITAKEAADLALIRSRFLPMPGAPSAAQLSNADIAYDTWNIVLTGKQIKGKIISSPDQIASMIDVYGRDFRVNGTESSRKKAENLMRLLLDSGLAGGSRAWMAGGAPGYSHRTFFSALKHLSEGAFSSDLNSRIKDWLYWSGRLGIGWLSKEQQNSRYNTDNIHVLYDLYFNAVFFSNSDEEAVQMLKCLKRYFEGFCQGHKGNGDGPKIGGNGFHHGAHHNSYLYAYSSFMHPILTRLQNTDFQIDSAAYAFFRSAVISLDVSKNGGQYANSLCGRAPFSTGAGLNAGQMNTLANIGGGILGTPYDDIMAGHRNWRYGTDPAFAATPPLVQQGFWQKNYSPLGVYRHGDWVADIRGHSSYFWGTEIYSGANRYGRYQSFGAIEILYSGGLAGSGFKSAGWDWNKPPGTTTVHLDYSLLNPPGSRHDEYNDSPFSGCLRFDEIKDGIGLEHGKMGVYGYQLKQRAYANSSLLQAKKSVFCVDGMMVCLGTDISSPSTLGNTATNLFQGFLNTSDTPISIDGNEETAFPTSNTLDASTDHWFLDAYGTAYYVYAGSGNIIVERKNQTSPNQNGSGATTTADYANAYIDHGIAPTSGGYEYVIAPAKTAASLAAWKDTLAQAALKPFEVRKKDATAHIVFFKKDSIEASVFFQANTDIDTGRVVGNSHPTLFMSQITGDTMYVTLTNPSVNLVNGASAVQDISIVLKGEWAALSRDAGVGKSSIQNGNSELTFSTIDGLPLDAVLFKTSQLQLDVVPTNGYGSHGGSATASATGGTGNYVFTWSTGATGTAIQGLPDGTYTVTEDDGFQTVTKPFTIQNCLIQKGFIE